MQIMLLGVLAHQERQLDVGQVPEEARVPERSTLRARRFITPCLVSPRITKADRKNCDFCFFVENRSIQSEPIAQTITACIVPSDTRLVDLFPRCLTDDQ